MNRRRIAVFLTAHGYGVPPARIEAILEKLEDKELADLLYVCQRAAEKLGPDAFDKDV